MSGPKKSRYKIEYEQRKELQQERRLQQQQDIKCQIRQLQVELNNLSQQYDSAAVNVITRAEQWLSEVNNNLNADLRQCWRGLKGVQSYVNNQRGSLERNKQREIQTKATFERNKQREIQTKATMDHAERIIHELDGTVGEYASLLPQGIAPRIELVKESLRGSPDNPNTLKQARDLQTKMDDIIEEKLKRRDEAKYVIQSLGSIVTPSGGAPDASGSAISGSINGIPVTISAEDDGGLNIDLPENGSCQGAVNAIAGQLKQHSIELGPVKVVRTGQVFQCSNTASATPSRRLSDNA